MMSFGIDGDEAAADLSWPAAPSPALENLAGEA
jgi:hypothetical protein